MIVQIKGLIAEHRVYDLLKARGFKQGKVWYVWSKGDLIASVGGPNKEHLLITMWYRKRR